MVILENLLQIIPVSLFFVLVFSGMALAGKVQMAAVQMKLDIRDYYSRKRYERKISSLMKQVADRLNPGLPALVVFPEDVGLMLIAQGNENTLQDVSTLKEAIKKMTLRYLLPVLGYRLRFGISWVPALYYHHHPLIAETYFETFSMLAEKYQVHIAAGSVPLPHYRIKDGRVLYRGKPLGPGIYNTAYLFNPEGKVTGCQDKVHLLELEQEEGLHLTPGSIKDIRVFPTEAGRIGIAVCLDGFQEDVINRLREQQANILIQPSANPQTWDREQQEDWLTGSYHFTHRLGYFKVAVNPMMNGNLLDLSFYGQSSIITREKNSTSGKYRDLKPQKGFLAVSDSDDREEIMIAEVVL